MTETRKKGYLMILLIGYWFLFGIWDLKFGAYLGFGAWNLGFIFRSGCIFGGYLLHSYKTWEKT